MGAPCWSVALRCRLWESSWLAAWADPPDGPLGPKALVEAARIKGGVMARLGGFDSLMMRAPRCGPARRTRSRVQLNEAPCKGVGMSQGVCRPRPDALG